MAGPKVAIIGAGSYFFGRPAIHKMATSEVLAGGTLALIDTNPAVLDTMMRLAKRIIGETECGVRVIGSTDRQEVIADSDFVVFSFSERNTHFRAIDTAVAARHGIRMCSSDTIGPGGILRALREVPHAMQMVEDIRELAPDAWVINFVNPTAVFGIALMRFAPDLKSFALCDGHHEPYATTDFCIRAGLLPAGAEETPLEMQRKIDLAIAGVNHCTFVLRFNYEGRDMLPRIREWQMERVEEEKVNNPGIPDAKSRYNHSYALQLFDIYGVYPDVISHQKEYVPFWQGYGVAPNEPEPICLFDSKKREEQMADAWQVTEEYASGKRSVQDFLKSIHNDHATDIIESMWGNLRKPFYVNTANRGAVTNMPPDAFFELRSDLDMRGPRPQPVGEMPLGIRALQYQVLDTHELTVQAAVTGDRAILRRAMLTDPLCNNIADADACIAELLEAEKDALPGYWFKQ